MISVGIFLKKEREKRKISLDQISFETKIGKKYLLAIEADNYTIFPGETYVIGFIRNYARAVGLDSSEVINLYKSMKIGTSIDSMDLEAPVEEKRIKKEPVKEKIEKVLDEEPKKSKLKKSKEPVRGEEDFEVVELMDELPEKKKKIRKSLDEEKQESKFFKTPLKEKKLINIAHVIIGTGIIVIIIVLIFIIKFISDSFSRKDPNKIYTDLNEMKLLEFSGNVLQADFTASEYYKIKLGDKTYDILFEKLTGLSDSNEISKTENGKLLEFVFRISDISVSLKLNEEKLIDFDYDTKNDLQVKVRSCNNDLINARIDKLHSFIVVKTNEGMELATAVTNTNTGRKTKKRAEGITIKEKIIFEAEVRSKTYLKAWIDGEEQEGNIYYFKETFTLTAKDSLQLKIGNAGGLIVKINGTPTKLGKSGEIANKIIKWERDPYDESKFNLVIKDWQ